MWINQEQAVSDENQESIQELQISFWSGGVSFLILLNKSMGCRQQLSGIMKVVIYWEYMYFAKIADIQKQNPTSQFEKWVLEVKHMVTSAGYPVARFIETVFYNKIERCVSKHFIDMAKASVLF